MNKISLLLLKAINKKIKCFLEKTGISNTKDLK